MLFSFLMIGFPGHHFSRLYTSIISFSATEGMYSPFVIFASNVDELMKCGFTSRSSVESTSGIVWRYAGPTKHPMRFLLLYCCRILGFDFGLIFVDVTDTCRFDRMLSIYCAHFISILQWSQSSPRCRSKKDRSSNAKISYCAKRLFP